MSKRYADSKGASLRVVALTIVRGARPLVERVSFALQPGDLLEIYGGNGSGKTTLLRTIAGFVRPKEGRIVIDGAEEPALAVHYVGHLNALKGAVTVLDHARYWQGLFGGCVRPMSAIERVGLARQADLPGRVLSQGQARRLALSRLLLAPRPIWLLDEPAAGLDAQGRALLADLVQMHVSAGGLALAAVHEPLGSAPGRTLTVGA